MIRSIGPLTAADEFLNHQIANTHAVVGPSDPNWTEKIWMTLARKDGTLEVDFGLGKYSNRRIMDGFAGVQRGVQQRTIRASRVLKPEVEDMAVGPLRYEVLEPFKRVRMTVAENSAQPLQFDLTFQAALPAFFENEDYVINNGRNSSDLVRYHQAGTISGWILIDGEKIAVNPDEWFGFRDRSWGVREHVGADPTDLPPGPPHQRSGKGSHFNWLVSQLTRPDGSMYELAYYIRDAGDESGPIFFSGYIGEADGRQIPLVRVWPELTYRRSDKALMGGKIYAQFHDLTRQPVERVFEVEALDSEMGFRLHPGMYGEWKGQVHGSYKGDDFLDGECIDDVNNPEKLASNFLWQVRDRPFRIRDGEDQGYGNVESIVTGKWPGATFV